jgi:hypothetical protein
MDAETRYGCGCDAGHHVEVHCPSLQQGRYLHADAVPWFCFAVLSHHNN